MTTKTQLKTKNFEDSLNDAYTEIESKIELLKEKLKEYHHNDKRFDKIEHDIEILERCRKDISNSLSGIDFLKNKRFLLNE